MERRCKFVPSAWERLEGRVVLSHTPMRGLSVVVSGLTPRQQVLNRQRQPVIAEVNQAFDSFSNDFGQARATYFASLQESPATASSAMASFKAYTTQRTCLLAQQIISSFLQSPQGTARAHGKDSTLKLLVMTKIIGPQGQAPAGSMANALYGTIPQPNTSPATASLSALGQDTAIETARTAIINGVNILKNGNFGNQSSGHNNK